MLVVVVVVVCGTTASEVMFFDCACRVAQLELNDIVSVEFKEFSETVACV